MKEQRNRPALIVAEIIMNGRATLKTSYGVKRVEGIADLIERESPDLLRERDELKEINMSASPGNKSAATPEKPNKRRDINRWRVARWTRLFWKAKQEGLSPMQLSRCDWLALHTKEDR